MLLRYCCPRHNLLRQILSSNDYLIIRDNEMFINNNNNKCLLSTKFCSIENHVPKIPQKFKTSLLNRDLIRYFSTTTTTTTTSESNELHNFRSISAQNKKMISKYLGLKSSFLNETDAMISNDFHKLLFNFCSVDEENDHDFQLYPLYFNNIDQNFLNNEQLRNGVIVDDHDDNHPEFLFYSFDRSDMKNFDFLKLTDNKILMIFDDIFDALAFYQQTKLPTIVIRLFNDKNVHFRKFCHKLNEHYEKIVLWPKNGNKFESTIRKKCLENFDQEKIYFINSKQTATQLLCEDSRTKFDSLLQDLTPIKHPFILDFHDLKDDVYNEFSDPTISGVQWSRFPKLNEHLKGHRSGELTIITGPTGCGKTTFVSEYSLDLCMQGVPTLWGSFEIKNIRLLKMMLTQYAKKNFSFTNKQEFDLEAETFAKLPMYFMKFHGQTEIDLIMRAAEHAVLALNIKHIVIDNLQFMLGMNVESNYDRFLKQDFLISSLRQFSTDYDCHITLVAHPRKEKEEISMSNNSLYGGIKASQEADNVMIIMNKFNARYRCNKYIQITKNRYHGSLGIVPLYFDKSSLCFSSNRTIGQLESTTTTTNNNNINDNQQQPIFDNNDNKSDFVSDIYRMRYQIEN